MRSLLALLALSFLFACSTDPAHLEPDPDAGVEATDADLAGDDAAAPEPDSGVAPLDAGSHSEVDAGTPVDAATPDDAAMPADAAMPPDGGGSPGTTRIRVMAANITTGTHQSYDLGEGIRIFKGLQPDVVLIQEFNYGDKTEAAIRGFVDTTFGTDFAYYRETSPENTIPNGIISRYPILASGSWDDPKAINRGLAWARLDVPGDRDLWAVSLHLRTSSAGDRDAGATELVKNLKAVVPAGDFLVVGGDFNTGSRTEACIKTLSQVVITAAPYPADQAGNTLTSAKRSSPLDWLLADADLAGLETPVVIGNTSFPAGLVFDSRVLPPLFDDATIKSTDSGAAGMQHMALVRDFLFP
ncbi:MAG: endonuclease [Myxococcales bacterium]